MHGSSPCGRFRVRCRAANLDLVSVTPDLNLYDRDWPIWTYQEQLPPAKFVFDDDSRRGVAIDSLVAGGCIISGATIRRSLLFSSVHVHSSATIEDSVILPNVDIGRGVAMRRRVVEKYCKLPPQLRIGYDAEEDRRRFFVTPRGTTLVTPEMLGQQCIICGERQSMREGVRRQHDACSGREHRPNPRSHAAGLARRFGRGLC